MAVVALNVGLPGDARYVAGTARSLISYVEGPLEISEQEYTFPGFDGVLRHTLGARRRMVNATLFVTASNSGIQVGIEQNLDAVLRSDAQPLVTSSGRTFALAVLAAATPLGPWEKIRSGQYADWVRRDYRLVFKVLSAD